MEELDQDTSLSLTRLEEKRKLRIFTAFEKLNFSKIEMWKEKYEECRKKMEELERIEKDCSKEISSFEK